MKTISKFLILVVPLAFLTCGEDGQRVSMLSPGSILESLDGQKVDLMSYGSILEKAFYVSEKDQDLAISRLKGKLIDSITVVFEVEDEKVQFKITPISALDFSKTLKAGDFGTQKNAVCTAITGEGICVDMYDTITGNFLFSMKTPKGGLSYCTSQKNETCDFVWVMFKGVTWTKKGCKGNPAGNQMLRICYDNNS